MRNQPAVVDGGDSFEVLDTEPRQLNYQYSRSNENQRERIFSSDNDVEEGKQDAGLRNVSPTNLDVGESFVCDFEQRKQSNYCSDDEHELEIAIKKMSKSCNSE